MVADIDLDGFPDVVFISSTGSGLVLGGGLLRAVSGRDGHELFTVTDPSATLFPTRRWPSATSTTTRTRKSWPSPIPGLV